MSSDKKVSEHRNLSESESRTLRYLALVDTQRYHQEELEKVSRQIKQFRREWPAIRSIAGEIGKHDKMSQDPEAYKEKVAKKKEKATKKRKVSHDVHEEEDEDLVPTELASNVSAGAGRGSGSAKGRLARKMSGPTVTIDKSLQSKAEK